jgi:integrase
LLDKFTGETPANYFARFKWAINAAHSDGYFLKSPIKDVTSKSNPSIRQKENLEIEEYLALLNTPYLNEEVKAAFVLSCYTGLRWVDVKKARWPDVQGSIFVTRIIQAKTGQPVTLTLHPIAEAVL